MLKKSTCSSRYRFRRWYMSTSKAFSIDKLLFLHAGIPELHELPVDCSRPNSYPNVLEST